MVGAISAMGAILSELTSLATAASGPSAAASAIPQAAPQAAESKSFSQVFSAAIDRLDSDVAAANAKTTAFAGGSEDIPLSDVMISLEKANLALQMAANVRDKVVAAYSNVMNMPV